MKIEGGKREKGNKFLVTRIVWLKESVLSQTFPLLLCGPNLLYDG